MSQLVRKKVIYDFRQEDMLNEGQGAPLTPIFHYLLSKNVNKKFQINFPICFLNIGGISNITKIIKDDENTTSGLSETSAFEDLKIMQFNNSIENEKSVISSRTIMSNVVDSLKIDYIIKSIGGVTGLTKRDLYGISPIKIEATDSSLSEKEISFKISIKILDNLNIGINDQFGKPIRKSNWTRHPERRNLCCIYASQKVTTPHSIGPS